MVNKRKVQTAPWEQKQGKKGKLSPPTYLGKWEGDKEHPLKNKDAIKILILGWIIGMLTACIVLALGRLFQLF
jgi:hypothetical protein